MHPATDQRKSTPNTDAMRERQHQHEEPARRDDRKTVAEALPNAVKAAAAVRQWLLRDKLQAALDAWNRSDFRAASRIVDEVNEQVQDLDSAGKVTKRMRVRYDELIGAVVDAAVPLSRLADPDRVNATVTLYAQDRDGEVV